MSCGTLEWEPSHLQKNWNQELQRVQGFLPPSFLFWTWLLETNIFYFFHSLERIWLLTFSYKQRWICWVSWAREKVIVPGTGAYPRSNIVMWYKQGCEQPALEIRGSSRGRWGRISCWPPNPKVFILGENIIGALKASLRAALGTSK